MRVKQSSRGSRALIVVLINGLALCATHTALAEPCTAPARMTEATPQQLKDFFVSNKRKVVTFLGYSGAEYEDPAAMLKQAGAALKDFDPRHTIVSIGATAVGIGAVYELAKSRGFKTAGIVSSQARKESVTLSPCVDYVFYVKDASWGGNLPGTTTLAPTSEAVVISSDVLIAIGGGDIARDELLAAKRLKKPVTFIPADMNHRLAREKAASKGQPEPTDFRGTAHPAFLPGG